MASKPKVMSKPKSEARQGFVREAIRKDVQRPLSPAQQAALNEPLRDADLNWQKFHRPVSQTFLANVMRMDNRNVKRRLAECQPVSSSRTGAPLYNFQEAITYLVDPKGGALLAVKNLKPKDLPSSMQNEYWSAKRQRLAYEKDAGDLWPTTMVIRVVGEAFKRVKTSTKLWVATLEREGGLTPAQRELMDRMVNGLLGQLNKDLVEMADQTAHGNALSRDRAEESEDYVDEEDDDFDYNI